MAGRVAYQILMYYFVIPERVGQNSKEPVEELDYWAICWSRGVELSICFSGFDQFRTTFRKHWQYT